MSIFPLFYSGSIGYYQSLLAAETVQFELHENFVKQSQRNRLELVGPNGRQLLVIPTMKTGNRRKAGTVKISYAENWRKEHWKSLEAAYRRSPYFEFYEHEFEPIFTQKPELLADFNATLFETIISLLKVEFNFSYTAEYNSVDNDFRSVKFPLHTEMKYMQVFEDRHPFQANLSILDALFNLGPQAKDLIIPQ